MERPEREQTVLIFVDGPTLYWMGKQIGIVIDIQSLQRLLTGQRKLQDLFFYTREPATEVFRRFLERLEGECNYRVVMVPPEQTIRRKIIGDIRQMYKQADVIVLVGNHPDYSEPLFEASAAGKTVIVASVAERLPEELASAADEIIDLAAHRDRLDREKAQSQQQLPQKRTASTWGSGESRPSHWPPPTRDRPRNQDRSDKPW